MVFRDIQDVTLQQGGLTRQVSGVLKHPSSDTTGNDVLGVPLEWFVVFNWDTRVLIL